MDKPFGAWMPRLLGLPVQGGWQPWDDRIRPDGPGEKRPGTGNGDPYPPPPVGKREGK